MSLTRRHMLLGTAVSLTLLWTGAQAALPDTLRIVVPFPPGNTIDASARWFGEAYRAVTGRTAIIENKPGAATTIAASEVSRAKPDGSVVLWTSGGHITTAVLMKRIPYDTIEGFTPVTPVTVGEGFALVTRGASPFNSVKDVVAAAKKSPAKVSYASAGNGNTTHVVRAMFAKAAGVDLLHVPNRADFMTDLLSGVVDMMFVAPSVVMPYLKDGKLKALGLSGEKRAVSLPDVPTFLESGIQGVNLPAYTLMLAPPNMPPATLAALHDGVVKAVHNPAFAEKSRSVGNQPWTLTPEQFKVHLKNELQHMQVVLPPLGIQMDI